MVVGRFNPHHNFGTRAKSTPRLPRRYTTPTTRATGNRLARVDGVVSGLFTAKAMGNPSLVNSRWARLSCRYRSHPCSDHGSATTRGRPPKQGRSDSNAQPAVLETAALPIELHP